MTCIIGRDRRSGCLGQYGYAADADQHRRIVNVWQHSVTSIYRCSLDSSRSVRAGRRYVVVSDAGVVDVEDCIAAAAAVACTSWSASAAADVVDGVLHAVDGNEVDGLAKVDDGEVRQPTR